MSLFTPEQETILREDMARNALSPEARLATETAAKGTPLSRDPNNYEAGGMANRDATVEGMMDTLKVFGLNPRDVAELAEDGDKEYGLQPNKATYDLAVRSRARFMADGEWVKKYLAGDIAARRQMTAINARISFGYQVAR